MELEEEFNPFFDKTEEIFFTDGHLPHRHQDLKYQFVTFRLADSLPHNAIEELKEIRSNFLKFNPEPWSYAVKHQFSKLMGPKYEYYLDQGYGSCILREGRVRKILEDAIKFYDGVRYQIKAYVIMPNHVHLLVLALPGYKIETTVGSVKQFAARRINELIGRTGSLWMKENFDRLIRSEDHLKHCYKYIISNPSTLPVGHYSLYYK